MQLEIRLPFIPETWNVLKGRSYYRYKRFKDQIGMFMLQHKKHAGIEWQGGVMITFVYGFYSNRRRDIDSLCTKPIIDALVDIGLLQDDSKKLLVEVRHKWEFSDTERTRIIIEDNQIVPTRVY